MPTWTLLTHHAHVLLCVAENPTMRMVEIAQRVGLSQRAVHSMVRDLVEAGYVTRTRTGRRNHYRIHTDRPSQHPLEQPQLPSLLVARFSDAP